VQLHTDDGLIELGETLYGAHAAERHIRQIIAPYLLGKDPPTSSEYGQGRIPTLPEIRR